MTQIGEMMFHFVENIFDEILKPHEVIPEDNEVHSPILMQFPSNLNQESWKFFLSNLEISIDRLPPKCYVDFSKVSKMEIYVTRELVGMTEKMHQIGKELILIKVPPQVYKALKLSGIADSLNYGHRLG